MPAPPPVGGACPTSAKLFSTGKSLMIARAYAEENMMIMKNCNSWL